MPISLTLRALASDRRLQILEWLKDPESHFPPQREGDLVEDGVCGLLIARKLRQGRPRPSARWHLDEMVVRIAGKRMYLWRAVDHEGEVLDMLVQRRRDTQAAVRLMRKLLKKQGFAPKLLVTDKLGS